MGQTRLFLTASKAEADRVFAALELVFEEDGLPIAVLELDEDRDLHEVSLYADGDIEPIEARLKTELASLGLSRPVDTYCDDQLLDPLTSHSGKAKGSRRCPGF